MPLYSNSAITQLVTDTQKVLRVINQAAMNEAVIGRKTGLTEQLQITYALYRAVQYGQGIGLTTDAFNGVCAYLRSKVAPYMDAIPEALQILDQPDSATVNPGVSISFSVVAIGVSPLTYQWRKNGVNISGATSPTYTIPSVVTGDAGTYTCLVGDSTGITVLSSGAVLTVNGVATISYGWFDTDPYADVMAGVPLTYNVTTTISTGADISMTIDPSAADNKYFVTREPVGEPIKVDWYNTTLNNGTIPDAVYRAAEVVGSFRYYITRVTPSIDTTQPLILST